MKAIPFHLGVLALTSTIVAHAAWAQQIAPPPVPGNVPSNPPAATAAGKSFVPSETDTMVRGPIHEAYAEPINTGGVAPLIVSKRPLDPIHEVPPDAMPEDSNATWIGGYWA